MEASEAQPDPDPTAEAPAAAAPESPVPGAAATPEPKAPEPPETADPPAAAPPAAAPPPAAAAPPATTTAANDRKRKGTLRERVALDRERERQKLDERLKGRLPRVLASVALALVVGFLCRAPLLRVVARTDNRFSEWAVKRLAKMRDAGSFDLYLERLGVPDQRETYNELVYLGGGRPSIPDPGDEPEPEEPEAIEAHRELIRRGLQGERQDLRRGCLYALWSLQDRSWTRDPTTLGSVAGLLEPPCDDTIARRYAAMVLKARPAPAETHAALLRAALSDDDRDVRRNAVEALGHTGVAELGESMLPSLKDQFPEVRREASLALSRLKYHVPLATLEGIYRDDHPSMQSEVLEIIAKRGEPEVVPLLVEALDSEAASARLVAVAGLAGRTGEGVLRGLEGALRDANASVRLAAIEALAGRKDGLKAVPSLVHALHRHEGWQEISALHGALRDLTRQEVPPPTPLRESWQPVVDAWDAFLESRQ